MSVDDCRRIGWKILLALLVVVRMGQGGPVEAQETQGPAAVPVKVERVIKSDVRPLVSLIGTAEPFRTSVVASAIEGLVADYSVRLGQRVKGGEVLAGIEKRPLNLDLKQAEASLAEASENYSNALAELKRSEELFKKKTISSKAYDTALYTASALKQRILALEARIESLRYDLARCTIRAPFSGFVVAEHAQVGQWLTEGGPVVTLAELDPVLVTVPVPDRYVSFIRAGQQVELSFEFLGEEGKRRGNVRDVIPAGNEKARTFPVQVIVENKGFSILAGMSCEVEFPVGRTRPALTVNKDAVVTGSESHQIFVVREGKAVLVPVEKGQAYDGRVVVEGDVTAGEMAVVEGNERLRPGQKVSIIGASE